MAEDKGGAARGRPMGKIELVGLGGSPRPELSAEAVDPEGKRTRIAVGGAGEIELDERLVGKGHALELKGPGGIRRYSYDALAGALRTEGFYRLPEAAWRGLVYVPLTCVTGHVEVCRPIWYARLPEYALGPYATLAQLIQPTPGPLGPYLPPPWLFPCEPVCQGKVEVFLRTCCCPPLGPLDPPIVIKRLCEIIDCEPIWPPRPWPPEGPIGPKPAPGPDPLPMLERATVRALKRARAEDGAPDAETVRFASQHLAALMTLPRSEQVAYIQSRPQLVGWCCSCSMVPVGETVLQSDGHFDQCFSAPALPYGCSYRVLYRVQQFQNATWVVIYDGLARNESFPLNTDAALSASWTAHSCGYEPPWPPGAKPFVLLEQVGNTWADTLIHSTQQNGETSFAGPLGPKDGLANAAPAGPVPVGAGPYDQPWGQTLNARFQFHPGLAALPGPGGGAKYYRTRVVRVDANGQALSSFTWRGAVSWLKYYAPPGGGIGVRWVDLSNPPVNGIEGLYTIPYPDATYPWLGGQWHAYIDTTAAAVGNSPMPNGRYLFLVDIFNAAGERLVPDTSSVPAGAGERTQPFDHRRLDGPIAALVSSTSVVPYKALASLFWVDNLACYGDIEQIVVAGQASNANCQFLTGCDDTTLQLRYSARHATGFQWYHQITYKQGLSGPSTPLPLSNANVSSQNSPSLTFHQLLGTETKCAFAASLYVWARHTNGIGRIASYDASDSAAFALETTGPCP